MAPRAGTVFRLRVSFVEKRIECFGLSPGARAMPAIASRVFLGVVPAGWCCGIEEAGAPIVIGHRGKGA